MTSDFTGLSDYKIDLVLRPWRAQQQAQDALAVLDIPVREPHQ